MPKWAPNPDHYPILQRDRGKLTADNVRLAHVECNNNDYALRSRIKPRLKAGTSLDEIADALNRKKVRPPHGHPSWSPKLVRKAFVS